MGYGDFDKFKVKYIIAFDIELTSPLSIRAGRSPIGLVDNPIIRIKRNGENIPYIPGSTLKGVLRNFAEQYARSIGEFVCDILNPDDKDGELTRKKEEDQYEPCIICKIFGGPTIASHIYVYDALPLANSYTISVRRRVSINRVTGAQSPGKLFDVEYIDIGSKFRGCIEVENIDILSNDGEAKIFNCVFKAFMDGMLQLGGMRSVGLGKIKISNVQVKKISIKDGRFHESDVTETYLNRLVGC